MTNAVLDRVNDYYTARIIEHGPTPQAVDVRSEASQILRFQALTQLLPADSAFTVADIGCGYGFFFEYCRDRFPGMTYAGYDISEAMIESARSRITDGRAAFFVGDRIAGPADYAVASGVFNVHMGAPVDEWEQFIFDMLDNMNETSRSGFAFNCVSHYVDYRVPTLYYADPLRFFDHCKRRYSRFVTLLHDYPLYEFTILVRKEDA